VACSVSQTAVGIKMLRSGLFLTCQVCILSFALLRSPRKLPEPETKASISTNASNEVVKNVLPEANHGNDDSYPTLFNIRRSGPPKRSVGRAAFSPVLLRIRRCRETALV
jgi:hypothetical protein